MKPARALQIVLLAIALIFLVLHSVHLKADFPNYSPWMDWAKYTDEGWYGDAAIRFFSRGRWYVPGDFNPAAALPVWPLLEAAVFHFTGVGVVPARALTVAVFAATLLSAYALLWRWRKPGLDGALAPAAGVLLLAVSPFCYVFSRMAILEPLLILLTLLGLLTASMVTPDRGLPVWKRYGPAVLLGLLLPVMVLTKTTAVFLFPAIGWMVWARVRYKLRPLLKIAAVAGTLGAALWLLYYGAVVRPHFLEDYRYLFSANGYTGITKANAAKVLRETVQDGMWMGRAMFPMSVGAMVLAAVWWRRFVRHPLVMSLILWALGYTAFLSYHANLQPRYYLVVAVPLTLLLPVVLESAWHGVERNGPAAGRAAVWATAVVLMVVGTADARQTLHYVRTPEYTFVRAAEQIRQIVESDREHNPLVLSISGSDLSLMTGLPSICDDFGTMELEDRVNAYKPGWYVSWNQVEDDKMDALTPRYHLERVAAFPAMDDPDRNLLILYRLDAATAEEPRRRRRRKPLPKVLLTRMGQQPSATQLEH